MFQKLFFALIAICIFGLVSISSAQAEDLLKVGDGAVDFSAETSDAQNLTLSKIYGEHPVVLVFIRGFG